MCIRDSRKYSFLSLGLLDLDILGIPLALALGLKLGLLTLFACKVILNLFSTSNKAHRETALLRSLTNQCMKFGTVKLTYE